MEAMVLMWVILALAAHHVAIIHGSLCSEMVLVHGYPCQEYEVATDDGYILAVQRIAHGVGYQPASFRPPVFLQHGLLQGGDNWVYNPPENSLGFILADQGYDVWIGNLRGSRWSSTRMVSSSSTEDYWDWSWDEHAAYDLPAMINLVYKTTKSQVYYIGHSQGTLIALASLSQKNVPSNMIRAAVLLSPIAYLKHVSSVVSLLAAKMYLDEVFQNIVGEEFNLQSGVGNQVIKRICSSSSQCAFGIATITGPNCCINESLTSYYRQYEPQSSSTKNMAHFAQMVRTGLFAKYNYGVIGNLKKYWSISAPEYPVEAIPSDLAVMLAVGGKDSLSSMEDVEHLTQNLGCQKKLLYLPNYAHADFIIGTRAKQDVYLPLIDYLRSH